MDEVWKDTVGFEDYYQVSNFGKVRSKTRIIPNGGNRIGFRTLKSQRLNPGKDSFGYMTVSLHKNGKGKTMRIHQLVWEAFNGSVGGEMVIDHIDSIPSNNNLSNLQLLSHRDNTTKGIVSKVYKVSKYPNVSFRKDRGKWFGRIQLNGRMIITGHFNNDEDAHNSVLDFKEKNNLNG